MSGLHADGHGPGATDAATLDTPGVRAARRPRRVDRDPVELLGRQLIVAEPQGSYHVTAVGMIGSRLGTVLPRGRIVRAQAPLALDEESAPEPDLAVVPGTWADYRDPHPTSAALIVEVADSSLALDRDQKGSLYARARVVDY